MKSNRLQLFLSMILIVCLTAVFALSCGGTREEKTLEELPPESDSALTSAYNLMSETEVLPTFMEKGKSDDLKSFDENAASSLLPTPAELKSDVDSTGNPNYTKYEDAIENINTAINLIGAARKAQVKYEPGPAEKAYLHFIAGYLYTVTAAARLVHSPLGTDVINHSNGFYTVNLPKEDYNFNSTYIDDLNGANGSASAADIKKSCQAIIDAIYLLLGQKFKITISDADVAILGSEWAFSLTVDSTLITRFPNEGSDPKNNALYHLRQTVIYGASLFTDLETLLKDVEGYIKQFNDSLKGQAEAQGFSEDN